MSRRSKIKECKSIKNFILDVCSIHLLLFEKNRATEEKLQIPPCSDDEKNGLRGFAQLGFFPTLQDYQYFLISLRFCTSCCNLSAKTASRKYKELLQFQGCFTYNRCDQLLHQGGGEVSTFIFRYLTISKTNICVNVFYFMTENNKN